MVTGRDLRHFIRQPDLLTFSTIQPVIFVLLFGYVFGGAVSRSLPHGVSCVDFLLPGIFVQSVTFRASQTAVGLSEDLERGVVDRVRSMPVARPAVLAGRTVADLVRNIARALRHPGVTGSRRLDRRPAGRVHAPVRTALPADELSRVLLPEICTAGMPR